MNLFYLLDAIIRELETRISKYSRKYAAGERKG